MIKLVRRSLCPTHSPQGVAQRRREMASKGALPPGDWRRAAGRKDNSLQGVEIAHFAEGKETQEPLFRLVLARVWARKVRFAAKKRSFPLAKPSFRLGVRLSLAACAFRVALIRRPAHDSIRVATLRKIGTGGRLAAVAR